MDLRTHYPWSLLRYGLIETHPSLKKNIKTDVAIIGGGITGAMVAWQLQKQGIDCCVFDKRHAGMGSTAASTSLIQYEIDKPLHELMELVGPRKAIRSYELCRKAIDDLKELCNEVDNKNNYVKKCSFQFASSKKDIAALRKEYELRKQLGFELDFLDESDVKKHFHFSAPAGLYSYEAAQVDAYLLTHKILHALTEKEIGVYDQTNIVSIREEKNGIKLATADGCSITAKQVVIACGYESAKYISKKFEELRCSFAFISEAMDQPELWKDNCLIWETADPYIYLRTVEGNRILMGGKDTKYVPINKQLALLPQKTKALQKRFQHLFPHLPLKIDFKWAGAFATTKDGLPYIGKIAQHPRTWFALGYGGNGITFSLIAAQIISRSIRKEKNPDLALFSFDR